MPDLRPATDPTVGGVHPRPQLVRPTWASLDGPWGFAHDDADVGLAEHWETRPSRFTETILVPFPPESPASGIGRTGYHPVCWYRREISRRELEDLTGPGGAPGAGRRILLHLGAVDHRADVWVDGRHLGSHEGGQTPFSFDVTDALEPGRECHEVVLRALDDPHDPRMPRGKQDWHEEPHAIWYHRTSGIWRTVWLEAVPALHVLALRWRCEPGERSARVGVELSGRPPRPVRLEVELSLEGRTIGACRARTQADHEELTVPLEHLANGQAAQEVLWYPDRPTLLDAVVRVLDDRGAVLDEASSYVGLRTVRVAGGRFLLNDRPFELRSVLEQGYWPRTHLAPPSPEALRQEVELILSLGFNSVRVHQKVEDPRFLYWCDRLGLTVWGEFAAAYEFSPTAIARTSGEWIQAVQRDASHPCVIAWVPLNESWGVGRIAREPAQQAYARGLADLTRALDPTRPVVSNDGWEHAASDLVTVHDYTDSPAVIRERYGSAEGLERVLTGPGPAGRPMAVCERAWPEGAAVVLSEFGGIQVRVGDEDAWGYSAVTDADSFEKALRELVGAVRSCPDLAGFCWTQLTDTRQEANGLCDEDRRPKLPVGVLREIFG